MPVVRAALLISAITCIAVGLYLIVAPESSGNPHREAPRTPAASIGPDGAEPAWTHVCLGDDNDPKWCKDN